MGKCLFPFYAIQEFLFARCASSSTIRHVDEARKNIGIAIFMHILRPRLILYGLIRIIYQNMISHFKENVQNFASLSWDYLMKYQMIDE